MTEWPASRESAGRDAARYAAWEARGKPPSPTAQRRRVSHSVPPYKPKMMERMIHAQGGICPMCLGEMRYRPDLPPYHPARATFDHVVPRHKGGGNVGNRIAAHLACNREKGCRLPTGCELVWLIAVNARLGLGFHFEFVGDAQ